MVWEISQAGSGMKGEDMKRIKKISELKILNVLYEIKIVSVSDSCALIFIRK